MRLQVFLSHAGVCSRRKALHLIQSGAVSVNGHIVRESSHAVNPSNDKVFYRAKRIVLDQYEYIMLNKPQGVITTRSDVFADKTVMHLLPHQFHHLKPVGRLDRDTTGLLLFTNDGTLANRLTHPRFEVDKTYEVILDRTLNSLHKQELEQGIALEGKRTLPCRIRLLAETGLQITVREGRKRQIRNMITSYGYRIHSLKRITFGQLRLGNLALGQWRALTTKEVTLLQASGRKS